MSKPKDDVWSPKEEYKGLKYPNYGFCSAWTSRAGWDGCRWPSNKQGGEGSGSQGVHLCSSLLVSISFEEQIVSALGSCWRFCLRVARFFFPVRWYAVISKTKHIFGPDNISKHVGIWSTVLWEYHIPSLPPHECLCLISFSPPRLACIVVLF